MTEINHYEEEYMEEFADYIRENNEEDLKDFLIRD